MISYKFLIIQEIFGMSRIFHVFVLNQGRLFVPQKQYFYDISVIREDVVDLFRRNIAIVDPPDVDDFRLSVFDDEKRVDIVCDIDFFSPYF